MPSNVASTALPVSGAQEGGRRRGSSVKTLKKILKKAGLKTSGRKGALTRRAKKAGLKMRGGEDSMKSEMPPMEPMMGETAEKGGRRRSRRSRGFRLY